jgi:hypothetical protein
MFNVPFTYCLVRSSDSDYAIFVWRHASPSPDDESPAVVLHLASPDIPLPQPPEFQNPKFYAFLPRPDTSLAVPNGYGGGAGSARSVRSSKSRRSRSHRGGDSDEEPGGIPKFMKDFHRFHSENGVRTVKGSIGPVNNGESTIFSTFAALSRIMGSFQYILAFCSNH